MNDCVEDAGIFGEEVIFHGMADLVAIAHRGLAAHEHMEFHEKPDATFTKATFFDVHDSRNLQRERANVRDVVLGDIAVEDIVQGAFGDEGAVDNDDDAGEQGGVVVGGDAVELGAQRRFPGVQLAGERQRGLASLPAGAEPRAVIELFTSQGCNTVFAGLGLTAGDHVVTTDLEHFGMLGPLHASGAQVTVAKLSRRPAADALRLPSRA